MNKYISLTALMIAAAVTLTGCDVTTPKNDTKTNNTQAEQAKEITATIYLPDKDFLQTEPKEITVPLTKNKEKNHLRRTDKSRSSRSLSDFPEKRIHPKRHHRQKRGYDKLLQRTSPHGERIDHGRPIHRHGHKYPHRIQRDSRREILS